MPGMQSENHPSESQDPTDRGTHCRPDTRSAAVVDGRPGGDGPFVPQDCPGGVGVLSRRRLVVVLAAAAIGA
jgi:hypothetical protein